VFPVRVDYTTELEHDGRVYPVMVKNLEILRCNACQTQVLPDEAQAALVKELRRQAGLFQPKEIAANRAQLGLTQKDFARLIGVAPETVCRWENGGQIQQRVMNDFMRAFFEVPELRLYLKRLRSGAEKAPVFATTSLPLEEVTSSPDIIPLPWVAGQALVSGSISIPTPAEVAQMLPTPLES